MTDKNLNQKFTELDQRVDWFYSEDFNLENAVENYKSAITLAKEIEVDLKNLKNEIEILSEDFAK